MAFAGMSSLSTTQNAKDLNESSNHQRRPSSFTLRTPTRVGPTKNLKPTSAMKPMTILKAKRIATVLFHSGG